MKAGLKLPEEFKQFYPYCNGFEAEEDIFIFMSLGRIMEYGLKIDREYRISASDFFFAEYMIVCDAWTINVKDDGSYIIYNYGSDVVFMGGSLTEFLER